MARPPPPPGGYGPLPRDAPAGAPPAEPRPAAPRRQRACLAVVAAAATCALVAPLLTSRAPQAREKAAGAAALRSDPALALVKDFDIVQAVRDRLFRHADATAPAASPQAASSSAESGGDPTLQSTQELAAAAAAAAPTPPRPAPSPAQRAASSASSQFGSADALEGEPVQGWGSGFCGINANPHLCPQFLDELAETDEEGAKNILCHDGGGETPCDLFHIGRDWDLVDPRLCKRAPGLLFLWSTGDFMNAGFDPVLENDPLCGGGGGLPDCPTWAAQAWIEYADKWAVELAEARDSGLGIASPRFSGDVMGKFAKFFTACPDCAKADSPYYIDALGFNQGVRHGQMQQDVADIRATATALRQTYPGRRVILADTHCAGEAKASVQADMILNSGLFDKAGSQLDAVYWNVYPQGFSDASAWSVLPDEVQEGPAQGKTLGQEVEHVAVLSDGSLSLLQ
ncbi:unnamed protein product [Prorocentrum cordatum]|uniref:Uncharacterized protein n=1 Tax=Prorocentrum cordatum TaxID=2364126 RepID=A0ABN9RBJ1_9DINO|nr:unnamed protein product [Polarella glacialis]